MKAIFVHPNVVAYEKDQNFSCSFFRTVLGVMQ